MDNKLNCLNLLKKLSEIQAAVDKLCKDKNGMNFKYTSGDQVLSKIRPLMNKYKLLLKQESLKLEVVKLENTKKPNLTNVDFKFTWIDCETGEILENLFNGQGNDNSDKGYGMACTYAERYFLLKFFHIPTDEDDPDYIGNSYQKENIEKQENIWKIKLFNEMTEHIKGFNRNQFSINFIKKIDDLKNNNEILKENDYLMWVSFIKNEINRIKEVNNE